jgi:hypothetical protein
MRIRRRTHKTTAITKYESSIATQRQSDAGGEDSKIACGMERQQTKEKRKREREPRKGSHSNTLRNEKMLAIVT